MTEIKITADQNFIGDEKVKEKISELRTACYEYPPDLEKIEELIGQIKDIEDLYSAYGPKESEDFVFDHNDFLSDYIDSYMNEINKGWFGYDVYDEETHRFRFIKPENPLPILKHETYAPEIIRLFLERGYDMKALDGKVGLACLEALVYSGFNDEMEKVAGMLLAAGADPHLKVYDDESIFEILESHRGGPDWSFDDDYLDNRKALDAYYGLCEKV